MIIDYKTAKYNYEMETIGNMILNEILGLTVVPYICDKLFLLESIYLKFKKI